MGEVKSLPATASVSQVKKKIRDLRRLKNSKYANAEKQRETERALSNLEKQLQSLEATKKKDKLAKNYKMVRFFEMKKATRKLKREAKNDNTSKAYKKALIDYLYVLSFPEDRKYVALFASDERTPEASAFRSEVKEKLRKDGFVKELQELPI